MKKLLLLLLVLLSIPVFSQTKDYSRLSVEQLTKEFSSTLPEKEQVAILKALSDKGDKWASGVLGRAFLMAIWG